MEVTRTNYDTWLRDTVGLDSSSGCFVIGVPSPFVAECLERRMTPLIEKTLSGIMNKQVSVAFQVHQGSPEAAESYGERRRNGGDSRTATLERENRGPSRPATYFNPKYTFDSYVVGKSNRFAHAAAVAVADNPGNSYNPLFIHAGVGLGKTHLLHAIGHVVKSRGLGVIYASAEQFTNEFVTALKDGRTEEFRAKYRSADVLLMDDIQFVAGKEHSRETFFHTFNDLHNANKQIVITSDSRPQAIPLLEERLRSRFEGGLIADIVAPDLETRLAILKAKAEHLGIAVQPEVAEAIAKKIQSNIRELEGALNRLVALSRLTQQPLSLELAQQAVAEIPSSAAPKRNLSPELVLDVVCAHFHLTAELVLSKNREKKIVLARQIVAYLLREETNRSLAEIGQFLGAREHSTVLRAHDKIAYETNLSTALRRDILDIRETVQRRLSNP